MERPIVGPGGIQSDAAISYHAGVDQYLTVWRDTRSDEGGDIYGQRIGADGILLGSNFALGDSYNACHPAVAYNAVDEEWLVVWQETTSSGGGWVRGQRVSSTGELLGERFDADVAYYQSEASPAIAYNGTENEYLLAWSHTDAGELHGRRIAADGSTVGSAVSIAAGQHVDLHPDVAYNSAQNDYLVVWGDDSGVWAKRVLADGTVQQHVYGLGVGSFRPEVAYNPRADQYLVVATDAADGGPYVKMLRVAGDGGAIAPEVTLWDYEYYSCDADVTYSPSADRYLGFCWSSIGQNRWELSVWEADSAGNVGGAGRVFGRTPLIITGNAYHPGLACSSQEAKCMLVWEECGDIWAGESTLTQVTPTPTCTATSIAVATPTPTETAAATPTSTPAANLYLPLVLKELP
jgi:hypothetical protein